MSRTTERVSRDLGQIADQATPSSSAWDSIRTRIDAQTDESDVDILRLDAEDKEVRTRPWLAVAAVAAVAVSLAVVVGVVAMSGGEDSTSETATEAPAAEQENDPASSSEAAEPPVVYPRGGADGDLAGTRWLVYQYLSDGEITRKLPDSTIILHFGDDGTVSGFGGCNDYQARYDVTGGYRVGIANIDPLEGQAIQFSGLTSSDTVCASAELMEQEAQFFESLLDVGLWRIDFDVELIMRVADGGPHRLSARPKPQEDLDIVGWWEYTDRPTADGPGEQVRMEYHEEGTYALIAWPDVTADRGRYRLEDDLLTIHDDAGRGCEHLEGNPTGVYRLTFTSDDAVTFEVVSDDCSAREKVLDGAQIARIPAG